MRIAGLKVEVVRGKIYKVTDCGWCYDIRVTNGGGSLPISKEYGIRPQEGGEVCAYLQGSRIWGIDYEGTNLFMHTVETLAKQEGWSTLSEIVARSVGLSSDIAEVVSKHIDRALKNRNRRLAGRLRKDLSTIKDALPVLRRAGKLQKYILP